MNKIILSGNIIVNNNQEILLLKRKDHNHYETPGGKVEKSEMADGLNETVLKETAKRELFEELGKQIQVKRMEYFGSVEFKIPGKEIQATAHKFITEISGKPVINEPELFSKMEWIHESELDNKPLSPDLKLLVKQIKNYFYNENIFSS